MKLNKKQIPLILAIVALMIVAWYKFPAAPSEPKHQSVPVMPWDTAKIDTPIAPIPHSEIPEDHADVATYDDSRPVATPLHVTYSNHWNLPWCATDSNGTCLVMHGDSLEEMVKHGR